jgi:hypothetical protein
MFKLSRDAFAPFAGRSAGHARRRARRLAAAFGFSSVALVAFAPSAFAHHATVQANITCDGAVHFSAASWKGTTDASMTNPSIGVWYSTNLHPALTALPQKASYQFTKANGFTFSDIFTPPAGATSVTVQVQALAKWGDGAAPGASQSVKATPATGCTPPAQPAASVGDATCASGSTVHLANTGGKPVTFTISATGSPDQTVTVAPSGTHDVTVTVPNNTPTTITVKAPGMTDVSRTLSIDCTPPPPPGPPPPGPPPPPTPPPPGPPSPTPVQPGPPGETPPPPVVSGAVLPAPVALAAPAPKPHDPVSAVAASVASGAAAPRTQVEGLVITRNAPAPAGQLPFTGTNTGAPANFGLLLVAAGAWLVRRNRRVAK